MNLQIAARRMELAPALGEYVAKRCAKRERFSRNIWGGEFIIEEQRGRFRGEVILKVKGKTLTASSENKDPMALVDDLRDTILGSLKSYEERLRGD